MSCGRGGLHGLQTWRELGCTYGSNMMGNCSEDAQETRMAEWQFADDAAPLATTLEGAEQALQEYIDVARYLVSKSGSRRSN